MRIETRLRHSAQHNPDKTALVTGSSRLSYRDLDRQSDALAFSLTRQGVKPTDRILLLMENCSEAVIGFFAAWKAGAVACPLHPSMKPDKLAAIIESTKPAAIFMQARTAAAVDAALAMTGQAPLRVAIQASDAFGADTLRFDDLLRDGSGHAAPLITDEAALALLIHTSGSTGGPKGVMLSHANVDAACQSILGYLGNGPDDIVLNVLPLSFGYGITQVVTMASVGGTLVLEKSFAFPRKILERLAEEKVTGFPLVPPMAALVTGMQDLTPGFLPHLRYVTSAAAALPPALSQRLQQLLPATDIFVMYGQTECMRISYLPPEELAARPTSVGKAIPGTRLLVIDEDGEPAGPGVIGELIVEGPHVMAGYWQNDAATSRALGPASSTAAGARRLRTGDLFRTDDEGFLYFISRKDDIIKTRGEKVSPQEVERALYALAGVREAAVTGVDDPIFGQAVRGHVALEPGIVLTERDIIRHCASLLEDYMVPKSIEFRDALPRTTTGKIRMSAEGDRKPQGGNAA